LDKERQILAEKYDTAKKKLSEVLDEQVQERMESSRERALL